MNTTENNKLIAEFLGLKLTTDGIQSLYYDKENHLKAMPKFHSDWNLLMEVVEKIESLSVKEFNSFNVVIDKTSSSITCSFDYNGHHKKFTDVWEEKHWLSERNFSKIENTYNLCVEFIKFYNQNEQKEDNIKFARQCSITGEGMDEGWFSDEADKYFKYEKDALKCCIEYGYKNIDEAYNNDFIYWTQWNDKDDYQYEIINGVLTEIL